MPGKLNAPVSYIGGKMYMGESQSPPRSDWVGSDSVVQRVLAHAVRDPSRLALATANASWTRGDLARMIVATAAQLSEAGATRKAVVLVVDDGPGSVAALLAAELLCCLAVLLPVTTSEDEIQEVAGRSAAQVVVRASGGTINVDPDICRMSEPSPRSSATEASAAATDFICQRTSGSLGPPKYAVRSHQAIMTEVHSLMRALAVSEVDNVLCGTSIAHSYGLLGGLLTPLSCGATVNVASTPSRVAAVISDAPPTLIFSLGPTYDWLLATLPAGTPGFDRVRFAFSAGAPLARSVFDAARTRWNLLIRQDYGSTETGTIALDLAAHPRPESVGRPMKHVAVRLTPPSSAYLRDGEGGEIQVRSLAVAAYYLDRHDRRPCVDSTGWYHTRDAGSWDGGILHVSRRLRDLVHVRGRMVELDAVERDIVRMPQVTEVAAFVKQVGNNTRLCAVVAARCLREDDVRLWCEAHLPASHLPDLIAVVEKLARSPAGKIVLKYE